MHTWDGDGALAGAQHAAQLLGISHLRREVQLGAQLDLQLDVQPGEVVVGEEGGAGGRDEADDGEVGLQGGAGGRGGGQPAGRGREQGAEGADSSRQR